MSKKKRNRWAGIAIAGACIILLTTAISLFVFIKLSKIKEPAAMVPIPPEQEYFVTDMPSEEFIAADEDTPRVTEVDPELLIWPKGTELISKKDIFNIMLIGQDYCSDEGQARADSMILVSYNIESGSVKLISFMRDLYVPIPGYSANRLNATYAFGGMELLDATVESDFGVGIDGNIEVDFEGFSSIVDILGGIDITLSQSEAAYMNKTYSKWSLTAGDNHLDGDQVLLYSRIRYVGNADYERTERQRTVLSALINKILALSTLEKLRVLDQILPCLTTDLTKSEILNYAYTAVRTGIAGIEKYRIPADGTYTPAMVSGMSVLVPDLEKNSSLLKDYIYGD